MTVSKSEKLRREAGRLKAAVSHSDFWRDAGYEPKNEQQHRQSELRQIARNIMASDALAQAIKEDKQKISEFPSRQQDNIRIIEKEHRKTLGSDSSRDLARKIDEKVQGPEGAQKKWMEAREKEDFSICEKSFSELVELQREYARKKLEDQGRENEDPYKVLFEEYEWDIELGEVERLFSVLEKELGSLLEESTFEEPSRTMEDFRNLSEAVENPLKFHEEVVFNLLQGEKSSILVQEGPYGMERGDALMAGMNTNSDQPWPKAVATTVHEFGHVDYRSGLPDKFVYTPLGEPASDTIDEACARLWQVCVGFSEHFSQQLADLAQEHGIEADPREIREAMTALNPENHSRMRADELTYQLHIIARFRIERKLINGDIQVENLEEEWDREMSSVFPEYNQDIPVSEKFLQDVHWAKAKFGYFPTYTLGHLAAVQIFRNAERHVQNLGEKMENGDYETLSEWLEGNLYRHGQRYTTQELVRRASGQELSVEPFLERIRERY